VEPRRWYSSFSFSARRADGKRRPPLQMGEHWRARLFGVLSSPHDCDVMPPALVGDPRSRATTRPRPDVTRS